MLFSTILKTTVSSFRVSVQFTRHFKRKVFQRRFGYESPILEGGLLPRIKDAERIKQLPIYRPKDRWHEKRALFGQNDYIDILGDKDLHPVRLLTHIPLWLRGFKGKEYHMLLRKRETHLSWKWSRPTKWHDLEKRIRFLYRRLNTKTPT